MSHQSGPAELTGLLVPAGKPRTCGGSPAPSQNQNQLSPAPSQNQNLLGPAPSQNQTLGNSPSSPLLENSSVGASGAGASGFYCVHPEQEP